MASKLIPMNTKVKYLGYIHTDMVEGSGRPGIKEVKLVHEMLQKKNQKKAREMHPLFARGFDASLALEVSDKGMCVTLPASESKSKSEEVVMNQPLHKIAYVAAISKQLYVMMKRTGGPGKYRCHGFVMDNEVTATECTKTISRFTNEAFARLRHVTRLLEAKKKQQSGPPSLTERAKIKDEDQPWFHGKMSRKAAEELLIGANMTNGLFLVRQSERSASDFALSFCYNRRVYHNRIMKGPSGYKNTKGSVWQSLALMVTDYQSPHEDMQTIITEYVAQQPTSGDGPPTYMNVALVAENARKKMDASKNVWNTSDIQDALNQIGNNASISEDISEDAEMSTDIAYDAIYDDVRFGFGEEFIKTTLGNVKGGVQPKPEYDLDSVVFSCGDVQGEAEC